MLRVQTRALQRGGLSWACSTYRIPTARCVAGGGVCLGHQRSLNPMTSGSLTESSRGVSSSVDAAQGSNAAEKPKGREASAPAASEAAAAASEAAPQDPPLDAEAAAEKRLAARDAIIQELLSLDKVVFELKRQHELSMLRVEQSQSRVLKDQEDRGMYYEQNSNVHTFDTISVGLYSQRSTLYHTMSAERLRNLKIFLMVFTTLATSVYFYYRYIINPEWEYVEKPMKMIGSRVQAVRDQRWSMLSGEEKFDEMRKRDMANTSRGE